MWEQSQNSENKCGEGLESAGHLASMARELERRKKDMAMNPRKAIFITGGASGIGRATAELFASRGWFVGLADVNKAGLTETVGLLPQGQAMSCVLDVRDRTQWGVALTDFQQKGR